MFEFQIREKIVIGLLIVSVLQRKTAVFFENVLKMTEKS